MTTIETILVTGGAGFIGSHLCDALIKKGHKVISIDDLSLGCLENIEHLKTNPSFKFIELDIIQSEKLSNVFQEEGITLVFHLAANSDIQKGAHDLKVDLNRTFLTTFSVLECMKKNNVKKLIFSSTSAIYGEHQKSIHENIGPLFPTSFYGAAKLSSEAYIAAYVVHFGIQAWILRFPNVIGERTTHGVIYDFINKLIKNPKELLILGDGKQNKPYLYVKDLVDGMIFSWQNSHESLNYFNLGVNSSTTVEKIAKIIIQEMNLSNVQLKYTGGKRGWVGDVPFFQYDLGKINKLGWKASRTSDEAVQESVRAELARRKILKT